VAKMVLGLLVLLAGAFAWNAPAAFAQRGQCLSGDSGMDLIMNGDGFDVSATASLAVSDDTTVAAELHRAKQGGPEEIIATGTALNSGSGVVAYSAWVSRDSLGSPGDVVSVYGYFNVPGQSPKRTCGILNIHL